MPIRSIADLKDSEVREIMGSLHHLQSGEKLTDGDIATMTGRTTDILNIQKFYSALHERYLQILTDHFSSE